MDSLKTTLQNNLIYSRSDFKWYEKFHRFGANDPYNSIGTTREYTFFTKPDCNIFIPRTNTIQSVFVDDPYFVDLKERYPYVLHSLQRGSVSGNSDIDQSPFMTILSNALTSTIDLPALQATDMDNASNVYGTTISYRKDAWAGDEGIDFSLEFNDSRYTEIYHLTKAYEEYERRQNIGLIYPPNNGNPSANNSPNFNEYMEYKELHDTFGIYKFIVDEDMETLIYWAYLCGVYFKSVPRDAFNDMGNNLHLAIDFHAWNAEDLNPMILVQFNRLIKQAYGDYSPVALMNSNSNKNKDKYFPNHEHVPIYNNITNSIDGRWVKFPYVVKVNMTDRDDAWYGSKGMKYKYKLRWYA